MRDAFYKCGCFVEWEWMYAIKHIFKLLVKCIPKSQFLKKITKEMKYLSLYLMSYAEEFPGLLVVPSWQLL